MAKIVSGILGFYKGNLGPVRGAKVNGQAVVKERKNGQTVNQKKALELYKKKLGTLSHKLQPFNNYVINVSMKNNRLKESAYSRFISINYPIVNNDFIVNLSNLILSKGPYPGYKISEFYFFPLLNQIIVIPNVNYNMSVGASNDNIDLILYSSKKEYVYIYENMANRSSGLILLPNENYENGDLLFLYSLSRNSNNNYKSVTAVITTLFNT